MIHDKQRIARMAEELISDFLRYGCTDMDLKILEREDLYIISISAYCKGIKGREVEKIRKLPLCRDVAESRRGRRSYDWMVVARRSGVPAANGAG